MVSEGDLIRVIAEKLKQYHAKNIVVDPVMVATSGARLISEDAIGTLKKQLFPLAAVLTPNIPEAEELTGMQIKNTEDMIAAAKQIAEENYEEIVEINFKQIPSAMDIFSGDLTVDNMVMAMRFRFPEKKIIPGKTMIFLDEIQECQEAITSLKFWALDNRFDVIASGSLLGIDYKRASSYPVGYVDYLKMYGIDFEEFLWGMGISEDMIMNLCGYLDSKTAIPKAIHSQMMKYFRQYVAIGGMPEAVQKYIDTKDFREVDRIQRSLLQGYQYDIAHYATAEEKVKAEKCYLSLAKQLLDKENHKFQYKEVEHGGRAQKYFSSIEWLLRADML